MAKNINQIATSAGSVLSTDKLYLGRSPFGLTDDRYLLGSDLIAQFVPSTFNNVTGTSQAMAVNHGYIANNAGLVTMTLPATAAIGSELEVAGNGAGGWIIAQNALQIIHIGNAASTPGVGGSVASSNRYDSIRLVCTVVDKEFVTVGGPQGNLTIV